MSDRPSLFESLRKRHVFRTAATYAVVAWGAVQVVVTVAPELGLPDWSGRATIVAALLGFPVVVTLAWAFDLSESGVRRWRVWAPVAVALALVSGLAVTFLPGGTGVDVETLTAVVEEARVRSGGEEFVVAFEFLSQSGALTAEDSAVAALVGEITDTVTIRSEPEGAEVLVAAWLPGRADPEPHLRSIGHTPLEGVRLPKGLHYVRLELDGYRPAERPLTTLDADQIGGDTEAASLAEVALDVELEPLDGAAEGFVRVAGGNYTLVSSDLPPGLTASIDEFLIGRFEVTNEEYEGFVAAGGYEDDRFWEYEFVRGDRVLSFEEATALFVDRTGLHGPRGWSGQSYPAGAADHPVTGVTWYEAAAFARYSGRTLPTAFQWERAARDGRFAWGDAVVLPWGPSTLGWDASLANFGGSATVPVASMPFGVSPYGAHAMAGNVAEWLANPSGEGRAATGGAWDGPAHIFSEFSGLDPFFSSASLGFRLVALESDRRRISRDQGGTRLEAEPEVPIYEPEDAEAVDRYRALFDYDPIALNPEIVGEVDGGRWVREDVLIESPFGGTIPIFLFLPKAALPPYQTLLYVPSGATLFGSPIPADAEWVMGPIAQSGRAVAAIALSGMTGNEWPGDWTPPEPSSVRFRNEFAQNAVEMRVALDYLESRDDIDAERIGYSAFSFGAGSRGALSALDDRFRVAVLMGGGIDERVRPVRPEVDPVNYLPSLEIPILAVQGRHDEEHPYYTRFLPFYNLLPSDRTTLELVPGGGHLVRPEYRVPAITRFLDEHFGPVER